MDLEGNHVNGAHLTNGRRAPQLSDSGTITALEGTAVSLFNGDARSLWTRKKHDSMNPTIKNSFIDPGRLVHVSPGTNVFVEQPNGSISMYNSAGELAWSYKNIMHMPARRKTREPADENVLLFSYPDAFLSTTTRTLSPMYLPNQMWIVELNSEGQLNWKQEVPGLRQWFIPRTIDTLRGVLRGEYQFSFYTTSRPLRDRDGVVYVVGADGKKFVVQAYRGE